MNHDDQLTDAVLTQELRDSLSELTVPQPPPLAAITSRGQVSRRRRLAGLGVTSAAVVIALVLGLTGAFGAVIGRGPGPAAASGVTSPATGTVSLRLGQLFDRAALQRALRQHGIRALVKTGSYCSSSAVVPTPVIKKVLSDMGKSPPGVRGILMTASFPVRPSQLARSVDPVTVVINPAAMPDGTELFVGYFDLGHTVSMVLIYTGHHTCLSAQDPPGVPWLKIRLHRR